MKIVNCTKCGAELEPYYHCEKCNPNPSESQQSTDEQQNDLSPDIIKPLPEYNEIIYHAKTLTDEQFREYWNDVQGNVL